MANISPSTNAATPSTAIPIIKNVVVLIPAAAAAVALTATVGVVVGSKTGLSE
jgi:hypothetical protein